MKPSEVIIKRLEELKFDNSSTSYVHIKNILKNQLIPVAFTEHHPSKLIRYRRHNNGEKFFYNLDELTYRKDILNINKFGRANEPGQGFFYCNDNHNQITGISEAVSIFRGNTESKEEKLTIGVWNLKQKLILAVILPSKSNQGISPEFDSIKEFYENFEQSDNYKDLITFNEFLADEFASDLIKHKSNYKITCAFSNYIKDTFPNVDGIMYPSLKAEYKGINIVLWPEVIDEKAEFLTARRQTFTLIGHKNFVETDVQDMISFEKNTGKLKWE